jgi:hypothetical protein
MSQTWLRLGHQDQILEVRNHERGASPEGNWVRQSAYERSRESCGGNQHEDNGVTPVEKCSGMNGGGRRPSNWFKPYGDLELDIIFSFMRDKFGNAHAFRDAPEVRRRAAYEELALMLERTVCAIREQILHAVDTPTMVKINFMSTKLKNKKAAKKAGFIDRSMMPTMFLVEYNGSVTKT